MMRAAALRLAASAPTAPPALGTVRHFAPQQTIFAEGDPAQYFMLVLNGMVRMCSNFADGRRFIGAFHAGGDMFGLERNLVYLASAEAVCETVIVFYPAPDRFVMRPLQDELSVRIFSAMLRSIEQARLHAQWLGRYSAIEKLSAFLLECSGRSKVLDAVTLDMTRQDIADYLGLTVETVSRCLTRLRRDKMIEFVSARQLTILDRAALRTLGV